MKQDFIKVSCVFYVFTQTINLHAEIGILNFINVVSPSD